MEARTAVDVVTAEVLDPWAPRKSEEPLGVLGERRDVVWSDRGADGGMCEARPGGRKFSVRADERWSSGCCSVGTCEEFVDDELRGEGGVVVWQDEEALARRFAFGGGGNHQIEEQELFFSLKRGSVSAEGIEQLDVQRSEIDIVALSS